MSLFVCFAYDARQYFFPEDDTCALDWSAALEKLGAGHHLCYHRSIVLVHDVGAAAIQTEAGADCGLVCFCMSSNLYGGAAVHADESDHPKK